MDISKYKEKCIRTKSEVGQLSCSNSLARVTQEQLNAKSKLTYQAMLPIAVLALAAIGVSAQGSSSQQGPAVSTSYSQSVGLLVTNGQRIYTTVSVAIPITAAAATTTAPPQTSSGGGGGNQTVSSGGFSINGTTSAGGNGTQTTATSATT